MKRSAVLPVMLAWGFVCAARAQDLPRRISLEGSATEAVTFPEATSTAGSSCRAAVGLSYPQAPASSQVGDLVHVEIKLGAGPIHGGTTLSIARVRFNLDCKNTNLGINCTDDEEIVSYEGGLATSCPVPFTSSHAPGDTFPNQVVFTPSSALNVPAGTLSYCSLEFDVRVGGLSTDSTPEVIEQIVGFDAAQGDGVCNATPALSADRTTTGQVCTGPGCETTQTTCDPLTDLLYPGSPSLLQIGATFRARLALGGGFNAHNVPVNIRRIRFDLDCKNTNLGVGCTDDGEIVSFQGHVTSSCGVPFSASHAPGDTLPNQIVFTPEGPLLVPAGTPDFCRLEFDLRLDGVSSDSTPDVIEQVFGMDASQDDAVCEVPGYHPGGDTSSSSVRLCICGDGNQCNGVEYCDGETGCVDGTPLVCDDHDVCTDDACDPNILEGSGDPCVFTDNSSRCDDHDVCTDDACDPVLGCVNTDNSARCDDHFPCTTEICDPVGGCRSDFVVCDDHNACTAEACDPATGTCAISPLSCDDGNSCTTDSCDPAFGCVHASSGTCGANPKGIGYWKRLCRGPHPAGDSFVPSDVACVSASCPFAGVGSIAGLCERLSADPPSDACAKAEAQLMALMLNLCRGRVSDSESIHPACPRSDRASTVGEARAAIDAALCDPSRTATSCKEAACAAEEIDSGHALGVTSLRVKALAGGGVSLTWGPPYVADDSEAAPHYRVWRRPASESAFVQIGETPALALTDAHPPAAGSQYEVTIAW